MEMEVFMQLEFEVATMEAYVVPDYVYPPGQAGLSSGAAHTDAHSTWKGA